MKKIIAGFAAGQALQLLMMWVTAGTSYPGQQFGLCLGVGILVLVGMAFGAWGALFPATEPKHETPKPAAMEEQVELKRIFPQWQLDVVPVGEMDEVDALPDELIVTNDSVKRVSDDA